MGEEWPLNKDIMPIPNPNSNENKSILRSPLRKVSLVPSILIGRAIKELHNLDYWPFAVKGEMSMNEEKVKICV